MFAFAGIAPNFKLVAEGQAAGKIAFDVIDRKSNIDFDNVDGKKIDLKGKIEFRNVAFYYPSRPDTQVLKKFSATFELG